jgi:O-acetyl-ADP-ribose deacetylase (regulator of RNase III)
MRRSICNANVVEISGDVLLYSTNVQLALTGGVGAALRAKFGLHVQYALNAAADMAGRSVVEVGDVFETTHPGMPWKHIFHSVATTEQYRTDPLVVSRILKHCLRRCAELGCRRLVSSPLGAGYGDLKLPEFVRLVDEAIEESGGDLEEICIVCWDSGEFKKLAAAISASSFKYATEG